MIGRQVIKTNEAFTLDELYQFMNDRWDREKYNDFVIGKPTQASLEEYILLPATPRFMVIVYSRKAGGLFSKDNKVILSVCDTPFGVATKAVLALPTRNVFFGTFKIDKTLTIEKERKGPAEDVLQIYTKYMNELLEKGGYLK